MHNKQGIVAFFCARSEPMQLSVGHGKGSSYDNISCTEDDQQESI
jgi:hypothetical protein